MNNNHQSLMILSQSFNNNNTNHQLQQQQKLQQQQNNNKVGFGSRSFTKEEIDRIKEQLLHPPQQLNKRNIPGGDETFYLAIKDATNEMNKIFGQDGWSCQLVSMDQEWLESSEDGRVLRACYSAHIRVSLKDGTHREDIGCGIGSADFDGANLIGNTKKKAVTDGLKRCLKLFGPAVGGFKVYEKNNNNNNNIKPITKSNPVPQQLQQPQQHVQQPQQQQQHSNFVNTNNNNVNLNLSNHIQQHQQVPLQQQTPLSPLQQQQQQTLQPLHQQPQQKLTVQQPQQYNNDDFDFEPTTATITTSTTTN
eukprot:gene5794-7207_t